MGSIRFRGFSLAALVVLLAGCGSGDTGVTSPGAKDAGESGGATSASSGGNLGLVDGSVTGGRGGANATGGNGGGDGGGGAVGTGGASDSGAGGSSLDGGGSGKCGSLVCDPAAICAASKCVCPPGDTDVNGDGTQCLTNNGGTCSSDAECAEAHCVGGSCCAVACGTPGVCEKAQGTVCVSGTTCQYGKQLDKSPCDDGDLCTTNSCFNGACAVSAAVVCPDDRNACTTETCDSKTGCTSAPTICDDKNPCTTDSCSITKGCQYIPNVASCNDGDPCTTADACTNGACKGSPMNCSAKDGDCTTGVCVSGACQPQPKNVNGTCNDGLDACDKTGKCNASGACVGGNDACGAIATGCATCSSGVTCFGAPTGRDCTCPATSGGTPVLEQNGQCVLNTDECATTPCVAGATCNDPSAAANNVVCTCPAGFTGDGKKTGSGCKDINECLASTNPCGAGVNVCTDLTPPQGLYSCTCKPGYRSVPTPTGPTCGCDLSGTYAMSVTTNVNWPAIQNGAIEPSPPGGVPTYSWALRQQTIAANGTMTVVTLPCGGVAPTLCDTNVLFQAAHAQYQPVQSFGKPQLRSGVPVIGPVDVHTTVPGGTYVEPLTASLLGLDLKDPAGPWPPCRQCVNTPLGQTCTCPDNSVHTVTNPATWWSNAEGTNHLGITTMDVSRGGETIDGANNDDPPINYTEPSECPRIATPMGTYNYQEWPGLVPPLGIFRAYQWYAASRIISSLASTSVTFDGAANACVIRGNVTGPDAGNKSHSDARIAGCETGSEGTPGPACTNPQTNSYDTVTQNQTIGTSTFILEKSSVDLATILAMPESATKDSALTDACETVRVKYCPPGKTCSENHGSDGGP